MSNINFIMVGEEEDSGIRLMSGKDHTVNIYVSTMQNAMNMTPLTIINIQERFTDNINIYLLYNVLNG